MIAGPWKDRAEFETWWTGNVIALNRLSVTDPREYERVVQVIEKFNAEHPH
jgi:type II secretory pathway component PulC